MMPRHSNHTPPLINLNQYNHNINLMMPQQCTPYYDFETIQAQQQSDDAPTILQQYAFHCLISNHHNHNNSFKEPSPYSFSNHHYQISNPKNWRMDLRGGAIQISNKMFFAAPNLISQGGATKKMDLTVSLGAIRALLCFCWFMMNEGHIDQ